MHPSTLLDTFTFRTIICFAIKHTRRVTRQNSVDSDDGVAAWSVAEDLDTRPGGREDGMHVGS